MFKLNLDSIVDDFNYKIYDEMRKKEVSLGEVLRQLSHEYGSDFADSFEDWYQEGAR